MILCVQCTLQFAYQHSLDLIQVSHRRCFDQITKLMVRLVGSNHKRVRQMTFFTDLMTKFHTKGAISRQDNTADMFDDITVGNINVLPQTPVG